MAKFISHRGESFDAPENTLAAFSLSLQNNSDGMECDVHLTSDGHVVVAHDAGTARMGSAIMDVEKSTLAQLRQITVCGSYFEKYADEKIPLLSETFRYLGSEREYYIELKGDNPELVPAVKEVVTASGVPASQIIFISFSGQLISLMKKAMPDCRALWLDMLIHDGRMSSADELLAELDLLGVDGIDAWCTPEISADLVEKIHAAGKYFAVWTVDNPALAKHFIEIGVDAITSNRAALLKKVCS